MNPFTNKRRMPMAMAWIAVGAWILMLLALSSLPKATALHLNQGVVDMVAWFLEMLFAAPVSPVFQAGLMPLIVTVLMMGGYAALSLLTWNALRIAGLRERYATILAFACSVFLAVVDELVQLFISGRLPLVSHWLLHSLGALAGLLGVILLRWMWQRFPRVFNRETVSYVFFGALTTLVNMMVYGVCYNTLGIHNLISNAIAWVAAVLFAYVVNKLFVFHSHNDTMRQAMREFALFIGARLFSFGVDELGMWLLVDLLAVNGGVSKIAVNVIVLVMNYFFSKWFIFKNVHVTGADPEPNGKA